MIAPLSHARTLRRAAVVAALLVLGGVLSGCSTSISDVKDEMTLDNATLAFVDPARYDFYDCKQLEAERTKLAKAIEAIKKDMAKADTGFAGPVVSEMVYRNDYLSNLGQARLADKAWKANNCHDTLPDPLVATTAAKPTVDSKTKPVRSRAGNAVY
jgi:hypothetical protein